MQACVFEVHEVGRAGDIVPFCVTHECYTRGIIGEPVMCVVADQNSRMAAVRTVHEKVTPDPDAYPDEVQYCGACIEDWPCDTIRALDGGTGE